MSVLDKAALKKDLHVLFVPEGKLYLLTNPLMPRRDECEIEVLFTQETLNTDISGKHFLSDDDFDPTQSHGKGALSKYVYTNYDKVDFSGFKPILDALNTIAQLS